MDYHCPHCGNDTDVTGKKPIYPFGMDKEQWKKFVAVKAMQGILSAGKCERLKAMEAGELMEIPDIIAGAAYEQAAAFIKEGEKGDE